MRVAYSLILMLSNYKEKKMTEIDIEINIQTEEIINEVLDEARDTIIQRGGQELDWSYHEDTDLKKIVVVFAINKEDTEELLTKGM